MLVFVRRGVKALEAVHEQAVHPACDHGARRVEPALRAALAAKVLDHPWDGLPVLVLQPALWVQLHPVVIL